MLASPFEMIIWVMKKLYGKLNPRLAIDQFLTACCGNYQAIFSGAQIAVGKH